jgi:hypothetical protein
MAALMSDMVSIDQPVELRWNVIHWIDCINRGHRQKSSYIYNTALAAVIVVPRYINP